MELTNLPTEVLGLISDILFADGDLHEYNRWRTLCRVTYCVAPHYLCRVHRDYLLVAHISGTVSNYAGNRTWLLGELAAHTRLRLVKAVNVVDEIIRDTGSKTTYDVMIFPIAAPPNELLYHTRDFEGKMMATDGYLRTLLKCTYAMVTKSAIKRMSNVIVMNLHISGIALFRITALHVGIKWKYVIGSLLYDGNAPVNTAQDLVSAVEGEWEYNIPWLPLTKHISFDD